MSEDPTAIKLLSNIVAVNSVERDWWKFVDVKGNSYTASHDFTDQYPKLLAKLGVKHDEIQYDKPMPRSLNPDDKRMKLEDCYTVTAARHRKTGKFLFTVYQGATKETIVAAALHDKRNKSRFATVNARKGSRR